MKTKNATILAALLVSASIVHAAGYSAVAKLPKGMAMLIMDQAVSCNGGPTAILQDAYGKKIDQTCNVQITADGARTLFAGYGKPIFWSKDQFTVLDDSPKPDSATRSLMTKELALNEKCRGGSGDDPKTGSACASREKVYAQIHARGWCWGHQGDIGADRTWVRCAQGE